VIFLTRQNALYHIINLTTAFSAVNFETWHLELVVGLVIVISSSRYILLQTWSDFRDSSEAANRQVCNYAYFECFLSCIFSWIYWFHISTC
jgi:hypothetical protein